MSDGLWAQTGADPDGSGRGPDMAADATRGMTTPAVDAPGCAQWTSEDSADARRPIARGPDLPWDAADVQTTAHGVESRRGRVQSEALQVMLHAITHSGDVLDRHGAARINEICRAEQWRVFCSAWPFTIIFKLQWARALSFILGLWVLLRDPEGIARLTWVSDIPAATVKHAKMLRFTALQLRNGNSNWSVPVQPDFGLLKDGCKLNLTNHRRTDTLQTSTLIFPEVDFDGWYFTSGWGDPQLDPSTFTVHSSVDGSTWQPIANSWSVPACVSWHALDDDDWDETAFVDRHSVQQGWPVARRLDVYRSFSDISCLWPYYLTVAAHAGHGLSLVLAPLAAIWWHWASAPVRIIACGSLLAGLLKTICLGAFAAYGQPLPFASVQYTWFTLALETFLEIFVFPGPLFFSEVHVFERALAWGLIQSSILFPLGRVTTLGPVHILVAGMILLFRERKRREMQDSVQNDMSLFEIAWGLIRQEDGSEEAAAQLAKFENDAQRRVGSRHAKLGARHATKPVSTNVWGAAVKDLSISQRNVFGWVVSSASDLEAGYLEVGGGGGLSATAGAGRAGRRMLLMERRAPLLSKIMPSSKPMTSMDQLYSQATLLDPIFRCRVQRLAGMCRGHFYVASEHAGGRSELRAWTEIEMDPGALTRVQWPSVKHVDQALRKVILYNGDVSRLVDLVRQRIIFNRIRDICDCLEAIDSDPELSIVQIKNRFDPNSDAHRTAGYRDVVLVLRVVSPVTNMLGVSGHCCELQLAHREMANLITAAQHGRYLKYRSVMAFGQSTPWWRADDGFFMCRDRDQSHVFQPPQRPSQSLSQVVPAQAPLDDQEITEHSVTVMPSSIIESLERENVDTHIDDLAGAGPEGSNLGELLTERVFEVLRARCHVHGNNLESKLDELRLAVTHTDASMVLFARPTAALCKTVIQLVIFVFGMCCIWWYFSHGDWSHNYSVSRHARFTVHQVRSATSIGAGLGISNLELLRDGCPFVPQGAVPEIEGNSLIVTMPQLTKFNGWSMTSSLAAGSEAWDPVRFEFSYAEIDVSRHTFSECLIANSWRAQAEVDVLSAADQRAAVVQELVAQHGAWCMAEDSRLCEGLGDAELLRLCLPARAVREEEWRMISASACRWGVNAITCIPQPAQVFEYLSRARGVTHVFDLRPPWFVVTGVVIIYLPIVLACILCSIMGWLGYVRPTRVCFAFVFLVPGVMELITALGLATATRSLSMSINPWDSFYWWPLSLTALAVGSAILLDEYKLMMLFPISFGVNFSALLIHNKVAIGGLPVEFPFSSGFLLAFWVVFKLLRFYVLRKSFQSIEQDSECYEREWKLMMQGMDNAAAVRDLKDVIQRIPVPKERPQQGRSWASKGAHSSLLPDTAAAHHPPARTASSASSSRQGQGQGRAPSFLPPLLQSSPGTWVKQWGPSGVPERPTLDTVYMQACILEPIYNLKVQQLASAARGRFMLRASGCDGRLVPAEDWDRARGLKTVDRSIEKLTRSYGGHVGLLLDVVRQCVVFDEMQDMLRMCRVLERDHEVHIVRIKNRMSEDYNARLSGGYRDLLVNLCLKSPLVRKLGLDLHVCELQLILKQFMLHKSQEGHKRYVEFRNKRCE